MYVFVILIQVLYKNNFSISVNFGWYGMILNFVKNYEKLSKCIGGENVCIVFVIVKFYLIKFLVNL